MQVVHSSFKQKHLTSYSRDKVDEWVEKEWLQNGKRNRRKKQRRHNETVWIVSKN
jgi:hypothetical protein